MNIKLLNNCLQAIFADGEIETWGGGKGVGVEDIRGIERRQNSGHSGGWIIDSNIQRLNLLLACKEMK